MTKPFVSDLLQGMAARAEHRSKQVCPLAAISDPAPHHPLSLTQLSSNPDGLSPSKVSMYDAHSITKSIQCYYGS